MNWLRVLHVSGLLLVIVSATLVIPLLVALLHSEGQAATAFAGSIGVGVVLGALAWWAGRSASERFFRREALAVVSAAWVVASAVGCLPYVLTGVIPEPVGAMFETMSGFTTTGASVLRDVEFMADGTPVPRSILFWRCMTNWLGGVGIVVLFVAVLPALGVGSRMLFHVEVPGVGEKGFMPQIRQTAKTLWSIYLAFTAVLVLVLLALGLDWFDAVCHAFATLATGGFSTYTASVGHWDSAAVRLVVTFFMLLAGVNFTLYYRLSQRRWRRFFRDTELRMYALVVVVAIAAVAVDLLARGGYEDGGDALVDGAFQVASVVTTTGFATADFDTWPALSKIVLAALMFVGGCAGSTAGGIKIMRVIVVAKYAFRTLRLHIRPRAVEQLKIGDRTVTLETLRPVMGMVLLFLLTFVVGALILAALGCDMTTSLGASIACLGNIGPGFGSVGPAGNYADVPAAGQLVCTFLMLVGRLEILTALALFAPSLWRE